MTGMERVPSGVSMVRKSLAVAPGPSKGATAMRTWLSVWMLVVWWMGAGCTRHSGPPDVSGTAETDEVHVSSRTGGRVTAILASEGDVLKPGQLIVELSAPELSAERDQLSAQLSEWEAGPRPQEIARARAEADSLESQLKQARDDARRVRDLFETKVATAAERERAESEVTALAARLEAARQQWELLRAGTRPERLAQARAQLAALETRIAELRVTAPTHCVLEVLPVKVGDVVGPGRTVATLVLAQELWVRVYVPQTWLGHIAVGDSVRVRTDAFPGRDFTGRVEQVSRQAEFTPRNVQTAKDRIRQVFGVKVRLNPSEGLRAGMSVDVSFPRLPAGAPPNPNQ